MLRVPYTIRPRSSQLRAGNPLVDHLPPECPNPADGSQSAIVPGGAASPGPPMVSRASHGERNETAAFRDNPSFAIPDSRSNRVGFSPVLRPLIETSGYHFSSRFGGTRAAANSPNSLIGPEKPDRRTQEPPGGRMPAPLQAPGGDLPRPANGESLRHGPR
jgi:hypothetical protein